MRRHAQAVPRMTLSATAIVALLLVLHAAASGTAPVRPPDSPEQAVRDYFAARSTLNERVLEDERGSTRQRIALLEREQRIVADDAPTLAQLRSLRAQLAMTEAHADRLSAYDVRVLSVREFSPDRVLVAFRLTVWQPPAGEPMHAAIAEDRELSPVRRDLESELTVKRTAGRWQVEGSQQ